MFTGYGAALNIGIVDAGWIEMFCRLFVVMVLEKVVAWLAFLDMKLILFLCYTIFVVSFGTPQLFNFYLNLQSQLCVSKNIKWGNCPRTSSHIGGSFNSCAARHR